jgi:TetR/AcrR family fatty acid metabolism transcriptional regulator
MTDWSVLEVINMERPSTEKRLEILYAAAKLFSEKGFEKTTVDEIANQANVGKGTIYLYFNNKEKIFLETILAGMDGVYQSFTTILAEPKDYQATIEAMIKAHLSFIENNRFFYMIFLTDRNTFHLLGDDAKQHICQAHQKLHGLISDFLETGVKEKFFRPGDPWHYSLALAGIITYFSFKWMMDGCSYTLTDEAPVIMDIFLNGVQDKSNRLIQAG